MKKLASIFSAALLLGLVFAGCKPAANNAPEAVKSDSTAVAGSIVFFNIDRILAEYDMANDLNSVFETKANSINQEVQRRVNQFQKEASTFQEKVNKGLMTNSTAQVQGQRLQEQQASVESYANQKAQEINEEHEVMMRQIMDAISEYVKAYNAEKQYGLILTTSGDLLATPVVTGLAALDITDEILAGLNAEYVKTKAAETK